MYIQINIYLSITAGKLICIFYMTDILNHCWYHFLIQVSLGYWLSCLLFPLIFKMYLFRTPSGYTFESVFLAMELQSSVSNLCIAWWTGVSSQLNSHGEKIRWRKRQFNIKCLLTQKFTQRQVLHASFMQAGPFETRALIAFWSL